MKPIHLVRELVPNDVDRISAQLGLAILWAPGDDEEEHLAIGDNVLEESGSRILDELANTFGLKS